MRYRAAPLLSIALALGVLALAGCESIAKGLEKDENPTPLPKSEDPRLPSPGFGTPDTHTLP